MYIAGINGNDSERIVTPDLSRIPGAQSMSATLIADTDAGWGISEPEALPESIVMKPRGGFVLMLDKE